MLNRVSVNAILKSLFGLMAMAVVTLLALNSLGLMDPFAGRGADDQQRGRCDASVRCAA